MRNTGKDSTEFLAAHAEHGPHAASHAEEHDGNTGVDGNGTEGDKNQTNDGVRRGDVDVGHVGVGLENTNSGVHEQVRQNGNTDEDERTNDLSEEDVGELRTRCVARKLGRGITKGLALETCKAST